jgi:NADPH:quinone reductase-like Zn-dependent oxidoreductase
MPALRRLLTPRGTLVLVGSEEGGRWTGGMDRAIGAQLRSLFARQRVRAPLSITRREGLTRLSSLLTEGTITPAVDRTFPLCDLPAAITYLREGRVRGKIVVTP